MQNGDRDSKPGVGAKNITPTLPSVTCDCCGSRFTPFGVYDLLCERCRIPNPESYDKIIEDLNRMWAWTQQIERDQ